MLIKEYLKLHPEDPMCLGKSIYTMKPIADYDLVDFNPKLNNETGKHLSAERIAKMQAARRRK